jgi:Flp pilus assembly pilin Flp
MSGDRGAALIEYALLIVLIAVLALAAVRLVGSETSTLYRQIGQSISN